MFYTDIKHELLTFIKKKM